MYCGRSQTLQVNLSMILIKSQAETLRSSFREKTDWMVKVFKGKTSKVKMEKAILAISDIVERYEPDVLAIKKLHPARSSRKLNKMVDMIKEFAKRKRLKVRQYSIKELENSLIAESRLNKKYMVEILISKYPFLIHELNSEKIHRNPYHIRMFEAVALGAVCFHILDRKRT